MRAKRISRLLAVGGLLLTSEVAAQGPPAFEVASVRENRGGGFTRFSAGLQPNSPGRAAVPAPGQITITNATLRQIVVLAYGLDPRLAQYTLAGGVDRVLATRFDIVAKPPEGAPPSQTLLMLRALLVERFHLRTHAETRQVPVYLMTMATDGKLGPRLKPSSHDCTSSSMPEHAGERARLGPHDEKGQPLCPGLLYEPGRSNPREWTMRYVSPLRLMLSLAQSFIDRPLIDKTGLRGSFEWAISFSPTLSLSPSVSVDPSEVSISTALREQLGLKLEPGLHPIEVTVIDSVEMPAPN